MVINYKKIRIIIQKIILILVLENKYLIKEKNNFF